MPLPWPRLTIALGTPSLGVLALGALPLASRVAPASPAAPVVATVITRSAQAAPPSPAQPRPGDSAALLGRWVGRWTGRLEVQRGTRVLQAAEMTLEIAALDSADCYTWGITYAQVGTAETRPYVICPADSPGEAYVIDERNGIRLDAYRLGAALYSRFDVMGNLLLTRDELRGDTLFHEIVSGGLTPKPTGGTVSPDGDTIPPVGSYSLATRQVARLVRDTVGGP